MTTNPIRALVENLGRGLASVADHLLGGPVPFDHRARVVVGSAQAGGQSSTLKGAAAVRQNPTKTYAERVWLKAPASPWSLDLIRAAWDDGEAVEGARQALRAGVDAERIVEALGAYVAETLRRDDAEADALVGEWAAGR